jgi:hypothetical protein
MVDGGIVRDIMCIEKNNISRMFLILILLSSFHSSVTFAEDAMSLSHGAVSDILFDYDDVSEYVTFSTRSDGFVDITFPSNMPDPLYLEILTRLQTNKDIAGVLSGKGGASCSLW